MKKRLLMLGGSDIQVPAILHAKKLGIHVITADYLPDNPGHKLSEEYYNVSTTDKEKIYCLAKSLEIDGILAYASDPAAPTAAYVGNKLNLPSNPYDAVNLLCRKDLFKKFLIDNGFKTPISKVCKEFSEAESFFKDLNSSAIIKPVDSSGSKGISRISNMDFLESSFYEAMKYSRVEQIIIEKYIERDSFQLGCDAFIVDGKLAFCLFGDTHIDINANSMVPFSVSVPSTRPLDIIEKAKSEIQRAISLLGMKTGAIRPDLLIDKNGDIYILEIGPRNGGNLIPQLTKYCTNFDILDITIKAAIGLDVNNLLSFKAGKDYFSHYVIHSNKDGILKHIERTKEIEQNILEEHLSLKLGEEVKAFKSSNERLGILLLKYNSKEEMLRKIYNMNSYYKVLVS